MANLSRNITVPYTTMFYFLTVKSTTNANAKVQADDV